MTATPAGMTYADYLKLDPLLSAQQPLSTLHDEMLFIVIHQTKELWMKELLHELRFAVELVQADRFAEAYKVMARISRIQAVMTLSWDVLSTLTPVDYLKFRDVLGTSSGFQSAQFRCNTGRRGFWLTAGGGQQQRCKHGGCVDLHTEYLKVIIADSLGFAHRWPGC